MNHARPYPIVGVSYGRRWENTGLAVIERLHVPTGAQVVTGRWMAANVQEKLRTEYHVRHLERWSMGSLYRNINQRVIELVTGLEGSRALVVDVTATGAPLWASLKPQLKDALEGDYGGQVKPGIFKISGLEGGVVMGADGVVSVPRRDLVTTMQILLEEERFKVAEGLDLAPTLQKEMGNFRIKVNKDGKEDLESWREGSHDDLVLAVALSAWAGERYLRKRQAAPVYSF
jgi:hypothetical protein